MNFQWILLALFMMAIISNIAKAMRNPMLKNALRLVSILVAFVITFILQISGVFQNIAGDLVGKLELASLAPEYAGLISNALGFLLPFCTTFLSPLLFTLTFAILYLLLKLIHVNLVYDYVMEQRRLKEVKALKETLDAEKKLIKQTIVDNEESFMSSMQKITEEHPEIDTYPYEALEEREINRMVKKRIKAEKKKRAKMGFFKESGEKKAISFICGIVCGFLLFGVTWMGLFYTMDVLSDVTDGIKNTNASDTKIYQAVELVDKHVVAPYEESFVYKFYDSMAMIDLLNYTVRAGGKLEVNGEIIYADDVMRDHMMRAVRLACEMTSAKSEQDHIGEDISALTKDPMMVSLLADALVMLMEKVEPMEADPEDPINTILATIINNYKGENNREVFINDMGALSDIVVIAAENKLLAKVISDTSNIGALLEDKEMVKELVGAMSGLSAYAPAMNGAFTLGINMVGGMLAPADNQAGYEMLVNKLVSASGGVSTISDEDLASLYAFFKNASDFVSTNDNNTSSGILAYLADPLYAVEKLKDEGNALKGRAEELEQDANNLKTEGETLKSDAETLKAQAEAIALEIADLEYKKAQGTITPEEELELDELIDQETALTTQADDLHVRGEELVAEGEALAADAEDLANDVEDLITRAEETLTSFEDRIKGFAPFITYFINWMNIQKPFMLANEDATTAPLAINIDGTLYVCNTDILTLEMLLEVAFGENGFGNLDNIVGGDDQDDPANPDDPGTDDADDILNITVDQYLEKIPMRELLEKLEVTSDSTEMEGRVSELTDLVNFIILTANADKNQATPVEINNEWLYTVLASYSADSSNPKACCDMADKIVAAKDDPASFEYLGTTVEKMQATLHFGEDWTDEDKKADSKQLVEIIFTLVDLIKSMDNADEAEAVANVSEEENGDSSQLTELLGLLKTLGVVMDQMAETSCLAELPPVMIEGILKHEMLSMAMTPSMLYGEDGYISRIEAGELSYAEFMEELCEMAENALEKINNSQEEEAV